MVLRRIFLVATMSWAAVSPAAAESLQAQLGRCVRITGLLQRLACYDGVVKDAGISAPAPARPAPASPYASIPPAPAPAIAAAPALASAAPAAPPAPSFGSESLPRARTAPSASARSIVAAVAGLTFDGTGHFTVTLDNGQVWRQVPGDTSILRQTQVGSVRIARSVFGSYDLRLPGLHASYRVVRIQ
jgi:hypothetical protein